MAFGELLELVGGLGKFQVIHIVLLTIPELFLSCHNLLQNFVAAVPDHWCRVQQGDEGSRYRNVTEEPLREGILRVFLPMDREGKPDRCRMYSSPQWHLLGTNETQGNGSQPDTQACTDGWEYDGSQFTSTIVTEWDLVCDRRSLKRMVQSIYMAGLLIGASILGRLADKYGRRTLLQWSYFLVAVSGTCAAFSPSFPLFCFWRFLSGVGLSGVLTNCISLMIEWIPTRFRTLISMCGSFSYTFGQILLVGIAYSLKDWCWLQFSVSAPFFVFFLYSWWFSESARWLIVSGKEHVALKQLRRAAKMNGREAEGERITVEILKASVADDQLAAKKQSVLDLFRTPMMRRITCCMMVVWFSTSFAYYGLSIDLQGFGVDIYLIQLIFGAVDIPAKIVAFLTLSLIGRRFTQSTSLTLAGSTMLLNAIIPKDLTTVRTSLAAFGKGCLAAAFTSCCIYATELYPTVVRQTGMGLVGTMARLGAMVAPIVRMSGDYIPFFPSLIYGGVAVMAGITAFFLPETWNVPLPETIEDVENRRMKSSKRASKLRNEDIPLQEDMAFGEFLELAGGLGKFQVIHIVLLTIPELFLSCHNLLQNFVAAVPDHWCRVQQGDEGSRYRNVTEEPLREEFLRVFLPMDREGRPDRCRMYSSPQWHLLGTNETQGNGSQPDTQACTDGWEYDGSQFTSTIVTEWDLVCDRRSLKRMVQSIYMAGLLIGASILGRLADKYGRRTLLQWSYFLVAVSGTCAAFSPSFPLFCFWRFLSGVGLSGVLTNYITLVIEWIPTRFRTLISMCGSLFYTFGQILLVGIAYSLKDWCWLQLSVSAPFYVFFLYSWWFSESARWLIVSGKEHVALKQLRRAAKMNGREAEGERLTVEILKASVADDQLAAKKQSVLDLFRTPMMRRITCCMMVVWFSTSFAYYGLSIDLQGFGVDIYLIQLIFGAVDIPAKIVSFLTLSLIGRRFTQGTSLTLAGSTMLLNAIIPKDLTTVRTSLAAFGKGCLAAAFTSCYIYATELYPTVVRQTGMGLVGTMARLGAMVAPIVRMSGDYIPFFPSLIYGGVAVMAGITAFFLPETWNVPLPETIEDVENRRMKSSKRAGKLRNEDIPLQEGTASFMEQKI